MLYVTLYRSCSVNRVVGTVADEPDGLVAHIERVVVFSHLLNQMSELNLYDADNLVLTQRLEDYGLVDTVEELWADKRFQGCHYVLARLFLVVLAAVNLLLNELRTDV